MKRFQHISSLPLLATLAVAPAALVVPVQQAHAQAANVRSLSGSVVDKAGNKVKGAVVHLKDVRSLSQRSYITAEDGAFRFNQLSTGTDYEVWAEAGGKKSASKSISSFDSKKEIDETLKITD